MFTLWIHCGKSKPKMVTIQEYCTKKKITIPVEQHANFQHHLSMLYDTGSEDRHVN